MLSEMYLLKSNESIMISFFLAEANCTHLIELKYFIKTYVKNISFYYYEKLCANLMGAVCSFIFLKWVERF